MKEPGTQLLEPFFVSFCLNGRTDPSAAQKAAPVDVAGVQALYKGHACALPLFFGPCVKARLLRGSGPPLGGGGGEATARQEIHRQDSRFLVL